jgi:GTP-binding protein
LNALLYGDMFVAAKTPTSGRRGTQRASARLPRGLKAVTSAKPGETRRLNFYQLSSKVDAKKMSLLLIDCPGYGFAFANEAQAQDWKSLMESYLLQRGSALKSTFIA